MSGGGSKGTPQQDAYNEARWKYDWQSLQNRHSYNKSAFDANIRNQQRIRDVKNQTAVEEWEYKEKMRIFDYNNQVAAHNASVEAYHKQKDFNALAMELTTFDNNRKYNENLIDIGFKNETRLMELGFNKRDLSQKLKGQTQALAEKSQGAFLEGLQKQGQALATGQTGRSARKNLQSVLAEQGRVQAALARQLTNEETGYEFALEKAEIGNELATRTLRQSMLSAKSQWEVDNTQARLQEYSANLQAEANIAPEPLLPPQLNKPIALPEPEVTPPPEPPSKKQWTDLKPPAGSTGGGSGFLGALTTVVGMATPFAQMSDDRLKYDITRVGTSKKGIPRYTFRYRHEGKHGPKYMGTSAQDLIAMGLKDAVVQKEKDGFYFVDYSKLDVDMEVVTT